MRPASHGMDDFLSSVVPDEHDGFQQSGPCVEPDSQLAPRNLIVKWPLDQRGTGCRNRVVLRDAMFQRGRPYDHATCAQASSAARIASERLRPSRSARAMTAESSSAVNRTGMTCAAAAPRGARPQRARSCSTSYPASASATHSSTCASSTSRPWMTRFTHSSYYETRLTSSRPRGSFYSRSGFRAAGIANPAMTMRPNTIHSALRMPICSPITPMMGGPTRKAQ